jgi:signal transduction histidine kinase
MVETIILATGVLISAFTGLFVITRNPKHIVNRTYAVLTVSLVFFPVANYLSLQTTNRLFYVRTVLFLSTIAVASLYYLIVVLRDKKSNLALWQGVGIFYTILVAILSYTPFVFSGLTGGPEPLPVPNIGAILYFSHLVLFLVSSYVLLIKQVRSTSGTEKQQFLLMLIGVSPMILLAPLTGFVMPVIFHNAGLIFLSPIYGTFFVCMIGYAIIKHRLFDVRLIVARSLGYLLSIFNFGVIYGVLAFYVVGNTVLSEHTISRSQEVIYTVLAVTLAFTFQPLRKFFDRITNRIFYRDAYDPQVFLDRLNKVLVGTIELEPLLRKSALIIQENLKAEFCLFELKETETAGQRVIGTQSRQFTQDDINFVRHLTPHIHHKVIVTDYLETDQAELRMVLQTYDIAVLGRLIGSTKKVAEGSGYLILGPKKSGNPYSQQDIKILEIIVNELVIAIDNALRFEEIENFNVTLQQKVNEATKQLRETNEKLKEIDQTKDDFISMASHQLRTPLTSIKGYLSMVLEGDGGTLNPAQQKMLNQAFTSSQRMVYLISDLLNVSRLRTGKFVVETQPADLSKVIESEIEQLTETAKLHGIQLIYNKPQHFPMLMLDETKIRQVIMNFIDNALYYTPSGGHITVTLDDRPDTVEFTVTDDGIGVPASERPHMFTKFYRASNAKKARPDGTGLGLFMAKKVVIAHGGAIIFSSREGKGSTFGFTLAKAKLTVQA